MNATELTTMLHAAFGASATVRTRRPNRLYQLNIPAYLADGDAAAIFVEPSDGGLLKMSDQGHTAMRLSYTRATSDSSELALERLAQRHGFEFVDGELVAKISADEMLAGTYGLLQIEAEAEAAIKTSVARGVQGETFRAMIREVLVAAFKEACTLDYHAPEDSENLYGVDAKITGNVADLLIAVTPSDIEAERAVSSALFIMSKAAARTGPGLAKTQLWIAIPKDANALQDGTRLRLMREYLVPVPRYDVDAGRLEPKLRELAG